MARDSIAADPAYSRLARMLERLQTQRACLEYCAARVLDRPGPVLEVGLGKGRTFDHLRRLLADRRILVFDREVHATRDCIPPDSDLRLGDFGDTLPTLLGDFRGAVALIHADIGSDFPERDRALVQRLQPVFDALLADRGVLASDRAFSVPGWQPLPLPEGVGNFAYYLYQVAR